MRNSWFFKFLLRIRVFGYVWGELIKFSEIDKVGFVLGEFLFWGDKSI